MAMDKHPLDDEIVQDGKTLGQLRIEAYNDMTDDDLSTMKRQKACQRFHKLNAHGGKGSGVDTRVICTELVRQGLMDPEPQYLDAQFTLTHLSPLTVRALSEPLCWLIGRAISWMDARPFLAW